MLPGGLQWGRAGIKYLGVFLGTEEFKKKNWEGLLEKVCAKLSRWNWLLPQLSYRGRVLVCNNLVASSLWHRMIILEPPEDLVRGIQQRIVDFFWSGQHWLKAAVLYLPRQEGGQGLIDIRARLRTFRMQTVQRLLYGVDVCWAEVACALLRRAGNMGLDRHLFLMDINRLDLSGLSLFYRSVLKLWSLFNLSRNPESKNILWLKEEPLFFNSALDSDVFKSDTFRKAMWAANMKKIGHLKDKETWISPENLALKLGIKSVRLAQNMLTRILESLPQEFRLAMETSDKEADNCAFPELFFSSLTDTEWQEKEGCLLTMKTPQLACFGDADKKAMYIMCVKVWHLNTLKSVSESKWLEVLGPGASPKGCWRSLYKPPIEKRSGDLQWRIVHGIIATNRHRAHLDPEVEVGCPFCREQETVYHLFLNCERLQPLFCILEEWVHTLGEVFTPALFIYGPRYSRIRREVHVLINFLFGQAKLAIWLSRKHALIDSGSTDVVSILKGLLKSRIKIEFMYYKLVNDMKMFKGKWAVNHCICDVDVDDCLQFYI